MNDALILLAVVGPLALAALWPVRGFRKPVSRLAAWAALPAVVAAVVVEAWSVDLPWVLLGSRLGVDATGRVLLGLTAGLWLAGGVYARSYLRHDAAQERYHLFHLLTLAGNVGAILAQDIVSFVTCFTLMSLAAYGLIVHQRTAENLRAGRIYIVLVVLGELLLFAAIVLVAYEAGALLLDDLATRLAESPRRQLIAGLVIAGLGIKLGIMPLHVWLPLAHPAAPTPASAVLSGAIIKTGLLGMVRLLPLGASALPEWGAVLIVAGVATAFLGVLFGLTQNNPKTLLAYSSVSQMGLAAIALGSGLLSPQAWETILPAVLLFAVHHGVAKAALFLGTGVAVPREAPAWQWRLLVLVLAVPALALAGAPLTSGLTAKTALKYAAAAAPQPWAAALAWILPLTSVATALLMARFLWIVRTGRQAHEPATPMMLVPLAALAAGPAAIYVLAAWLPLVKPSWASVDAAKLWAATWPLVAAAGVILVVHWPVNLIRRLAYVHVPPGDIVVPLAAAVGWLLAAWRKAVVVPLVQIRDWWQRRGARLARLTVPRIFSRVARLLENEVAAGILAGAIAVTMFWLLAWAGG